MKLRAAVLASAVTVVLLAALAVQGPAEAAATAPPQAAGAAGRPSVTSVSPVAGPAGGGTTITIHGARFASGASVSVGGKKARGVRVKSATVLTAVVPAHPAGGAVIVVAEKAGASRGTVRFEYLNKPSLRGMSARSGPVTGGQVVTIEGRNFSYVTAVLFGTLKAKVLPNGTASKIRVQVPASWAATVNVTVKTMGGATVRSANDWYSFQNPRAQLGGQVTAATGTAVAVPADVTAVTGGPGVALTTAPWTVTLAAAAAVPTVGQPFLLRPGGTVYPGGLAGTVTAADAATDTITVAPATLDAAVTSATATFTGPLGNASAATRPAAATGSGTPTGMDATARPAGGSLTSEIDFGSIDASELACDGLDGRSVKVTGSFSLTLTNVEAHVEVDAGSSFAKPFVDVWVSYQPTIAVSITAEDEASCSLPPAFQNEHEKLFFLGDTGATIAIAPDASFTVSASGTVTFSQHSYRILGLVSNPDGSISRLSGQSSDPAAVTVSGELKAEAYGGVQIQVGELNVIGVGMSIGGGVAGTATSDWPPQVCLNAYPYLRGTLYAYLNAWVKGWKLQGFQVELDFSGIGTCTGEGWHVAWQSTDADIQDLACPANADCFAVGSTSSSHGYLLRTANGGRTWQATTMTAYTDLSSVGCVDAARCVLGGNGGKLEVTSNGGTSWSQASLPYYDSPVAEVGSVRCVPGGTCYAIAYMTKYSGVLVYGSANSGRSWTLATVLDDEPTAMTCLSASACLAVGSVPFTNALEGPAATDATRDGWASSTASHPAHWDSLTSVACTSLSLCYAPGFDTTGNGNDLLVTTNFGKSWTTASVPLLLPWAASCPDTTTCVIGGAGANWSQYVVTTHDGGHSWTKTTISDFPASDDMSMYSLTCPSLGHCVGFEVGLGPRAIVVS